MIVFGLSKRMFQQGAEGSSFGGDVGCSAIAVVKFKTEKTKCASECSAWLPLAEVRACFNRIGLFLEDANELCVVGMRPDSCYGCASSHSDEKHDSWN
jgi:hypothetical protein